jgi:hypothetical protein
MSGMFIKMSTNTRFSYKERMRPEAPRVVYEPEPIVATVDNFWASDKVMYGIIGVGIIVALLLDAGVHAFKKNGGFGMDRLQINGRTYVPLHF